MDQKVLKISSEDKAKFHYVIDAEGYLARIKKKDFDEKTQLPKKKASFKRLDLFKNVPGYIHFIDKDGDISRTKTARQ